jgi:hypothetical protein
MALSVPGLYWFNVPYVPHVGLLIVASSPLWLAILALTVEKPNLESLALGFQELGFHILAVGFFLCAVLLLVGGPNVLDTAIWAASGGRALALRWVIPFMVIPFIVILPVALGFNVVAITKRRQQRARLVNSAAEASASKETTSAVENFPPGNPLFHA